MYIYVYSKRNRTPVSLTLGVDLDRFQARLAPATFGFCPTGPAVKLAPKEPNTP